ncbi:MAG: hypothetical protein JWR63_3865 [Conexibacter sp.]|jgi:uncharacterized protein (TIGR00251 family)|nr:hypothetical protein [Conexibacter sp.]
MAATDLVVRLTPRADRDAIVADDGVIRVRVTAPPVGGQANMALVKLLAKALGVPRSRLTIVRGQSARDKLVRVEGLDADDAHARLRRRRSSG